MTVAVVAPLTETLRLLDFVSANIVTLVTMTSWDFTAKIRRNKYTHNFNLWTLLMLIIFSTDAASQVQTLPEVTLDESSYVVDEDGSTPINVINKGGANVDVGE